MSQQSDDVHNDDKFGKASPGGDDDNLGETAAAHGKNKRNSVKIVSVSRCYGDVLLTDEDK